MWNHLSANHTLIKSDTVDQVFFACLNFREFQILEFFATIGIREFPFFFSSAIIIKKFARFLNSRIGRPREIRENKNLANITRSTVSQGRVVVVTNDIFLFLCDIITPRRNSIVSSHSITQTTFTAI